MYLDGLFNHLYLQTPLLYTVNLENRKGTFIAQKLVMVIGTKRKMTMNMI